MSEERTALGTKKSAVESYVNLMGAALDMPDVTLHYWLDCYYQLRAAYEAERAEALQTEAPEPDAPQFSGKKAAMKRDTYSRLMAARGDGRTIAELVAASKGILNDADVVAMLNAMPVTDRKWEIMAGALDKLDKAGETPAVKK